MNIIILFIFIILCILLSIFINYKINKSYVGGINNAIAHNAIAHNSVRELRSYISNYIHENYNENIIKKKVNYLLNRGKIYHNTTMGDIAIDTLNLIYFIYGYDQYTNITHDNIYIGIEYIAKKLKKIFSGRIMFIIKDKNIPLEDSKARESYKKLYKESYKELSKKLKIYIYIAEKYDSRNAPLWKKPTWIKSIDGASNIHSLESRDDLALILLAKKYRCPILSNDNFSDNYEYRATIAPFKLLEYNWYSSKLPLIESYKPENLKKYDSVPNIKIKLDTIFLHGEIEAIKILN
jgi:hypothetical protein